MEEKYAVKAGTIVRTVILAIALVNQVLFATGHSVIPIADEDIEVLINTGFTVVMAVITWWKNNSWSQAACKADAVMHELKRKKKEEK